jgi:uncharacterized protein (TIRG00374 family)
LKRIQLAAGLVVSIGALYLAFRNVNWSDAWDALSGANFLLVGLSALLFVVALGIRAARWRLLFHPIEGLQLRNLFGALNVAYFLNNILPLQAGDLGRAYILGEVERVSTIRSISTIVVERILDVCILLFLLLCLVPFIDVPGWAEWPAAILGAIAGVLAVLVILASLKRSAAMRVVDRLLLLVPARYRGGLQSAAHHAIDGFGVLANAAVAARLVAWSVVCWLAMALVVYTTMEAFDLGVGYEAAMLVVVATTLGFFVPSSPGAVGVYHAIAIGVLTSVFDVEKAPAASFALVMHLVLYIPPMFIGGVFLWSRRAAWRGFSLRSRLAALESEYVATDQAGPTI